MPEQIKKRQEKNKTKVAFNAEREKMGPNGRASCLNTQIVPCRQLPWGAAGASRTEDKRSRATRQTERTELRGSCQKEPGSYRVTWRPGSARILSGGNEHSAT